jgi:hypothetical protein
MYWSSRKPVGRHQEPVPIQTADPEVLDGTFGRVELIVPLDLGWVPAFRAGDQVEVF